MNYFIFFSRALFTDSEDQVDLIKLVYEYATLSLSLLL